MSWTRENKMELRCAVAGSDCNLRCVWVAETAEPTDTSTRDRPEECSTAVVLDAPGYNDDEVRLSLVEFHPDNEGDGWEDIACLWLTYTELARLRANIDHLLRMSDMED